MKRFEYLFDIDGAEPMVIALTAATGTSFESGDLLAFSSGLVGKAAAASTSIAGVAVEGVTNAPAGTKVQVLVSRGSVFRTGYTTGTKTSLADADIGTAFDLDSVDQTTISLDDTSGGMCILVAYDNAAKTADVLIKGRTFAN